MTATPDLTGYHAVHTALRVTPHRLAVAAIDLDPADRRRVRALARYWKGFAGEVLAHHTIEDDVMFPELVAKVPDAAELIERTDREHEELDDLMDACTGSVQALERGPRGATDLLGDRFAALAAHMDAHLDFEDEQILPRFERHFTPEEYALLDEAAKKSLGLGAQAAFTVPFIAGSVPADVRDDLFVGAPAAFKVLYRVTRGRHERLRSLALGSAGEAETARSA